MTTKKRNELSVIEEQVEAINQKSLSSFVQDYLPAAGHWSVWQNPNTDERYVISIETANSLSSSDFEACFDLISTTSSADYRNSSVGWKVRSKKKEMKSTDLKYLLVKKDGENEVQAFLSFMPTMEDDFPVMYCYEIHLSPHLQGTGLGTILMDYFEGFAKKMPVMEKAMLSCFVRNQRAISFYRKRGYGKDEFSPPPKILRTGVKIEPDYIIMGKSVAHGSQCRAIAE